VKVSSSLLKKAQVERASHLGQRLEDESPEGQNLAQPGFGSRQPHSEGGKPPPPELHDKKVTERPRETDSPSTETGLGRKCSRLWIKKRIGRR